jgi:hypothetical protein
MQQQAGRRLTFTLLDSVKRCSVLKLSKALKDLHTQQSAIASQFQMQTSCSLVCLLLVNHGFCSLFLALGNKTTLCTGVLMGAVLLGVLINKASIPSARVVFSDVCLFTSRNGEPVLILRIGNTRGNFLLNPEIRVGYLKVRFTG